MESREAELSAILSANNYAALSEYCRNQEILFELASNFTTYSNPELQKFILNLASKWFRFNPADIANELIQPLYNLLFETIPQYYANYQANLADEIAEAQSLFVIYNYPQNFQEIWDVIFRFTPIITHKFLIYFGKETSVLAPCRLELFQNLKATLRQTNVLNSIITYTCQLMNTEILTALNILVEYIPWCDLDFITNEQVLGLLQRAIESKPTTASALNICNNLIKRSINDQNINYLINTFADLENLAQILETFNDSPEIQNSIATLVATVGLITYDQSFFEFSLQLLDISEYCAVTVSPFICFYISQQDQENYDFQQSFEMGFEHLITFFNSEVSPSVYYQYENYVVAFTNICVTCWTLDSAACETYLNTALDELNPIEAPALAGALSFLAKRLTKGLYSFNKHLENFVNKSKPIISMEPPFSVQQVIAFYSFIQLSQVAVDKIRGNEGHIILQTFINIIEHFKMDPASLSSVLTLLAQFINSHAKLIQGEYQLAHDLLASWNPEYVSVGASLLMASPQSEQRFAEIFPNFEQTINNTAPDAPEFHNILHCTLILIMRKTNKNADNEPYIQLLNNVQQYVIGDDILTSAFIEATKTLTCEKIFDYLLPFMPNVNGPKGLYSLISCFFGYLRIMPSLEQAEWLNGYIATVFNAICQCLDVDRSKKTKNNFIDLAFKEFADTFKLVNDYISQEIHEQIFAFAKMIYNQVMDRPEIYTAILSLLAGFAKTHPDAIVETISSCPVPVTLAAELDRNPVVLSNLLKRTRNIFSKLNNQDSDKVQEIIAGVQNFGLDPERVGEFLLGENNEETVEGSRRIYIDMRKVISALGI